MENTPARILIVDDEPSITEFVSYAMQKEGYQTEIASDGEEALRKIEQHHFDLFIYGWKIDPDLILFGNAYL